MSPMRPIASQPGGATAGPAVCTLMPLVCRRRWNAIPRSVRGVARIDTCREPASRLSRTINPALTQRSRFSMLATRTIAAKLPYTGRETKRNSSAVPQMSAPEPSMVHVPAENAVVPAAPTAPMSLLENPAGNVCDREATARPRSSHGRRRSRSCAAWRRRWPGRGSARRIDRSAAARLVQPVTGWNVRPSSTEYDSDIGDRMCDGSKMSARHRVRHAANHRVP